MAKSQQLQIRVSPEQKTRIKEHASLAGEDVSSWVLAKLLPPDADKFQHLINKPGIGLHSRSYMLAEIHDFLRLLFARVGHVVCPDCKEEARSDSPQRAAAMLEKLEPGKRLLIIAPVRVENAEAEIDVRVLEEPVHPIKDGV